MSPGPRWEYLGASADRAGMIGGVDPDLLRAAAIPPVSGTLAGNVVAANYNPDLIDPHTGKPIGALPPGVTCAPLRVCNQMPPFSGNVQGAPLFTAAPFAQSFTNTDVSNSSATLDRPFPDAALDFIPRTPT